MAGRPATRAVASALVVIATLGGPAVAADFRVRDFGAVGNGATDDGPAFRQALAAAAQSGRPARILCDRKTYRIGWRHDDFFALTLEGARDLTFDGRGATLVLDPHNMALQLRNCQRVTVRGLRLDCDPLPCTQGDIIAVDRAAGLLTVRIHDGYPVPRTDDAIQAAFRHGCFIAPRRRWYTWNWCYIAAVRPVPGQDRCVAITVDPGMVSALSKVEAGQRFVFRNPSWAPGEFDGAEKWKIGTGEQERGVVLNPPIANVQVRSCQDCRLEGIAQYISPNMSIFVDGSSGTVIRRYRIGYKPGSDRLSASLSDGIHCKGNITGPFIEDCTFAGLWDDAIAIASPGDVVRQVRPDGRLLTRVLDIAWIDSYLRAGDRVRLWSPVEGRLLGERTVVEAQFAGNQQRIITLDRPLAGLVDEASDPKAATILYADRGPSSVRNCRFRNSLKTALLPNSGTVFEGNSVEGCAYGVHAFLATGEGAQGYPRDIVVRGNTFRNIWIGAVVLYAGTPNPRSAPVAGHCVVEGNAIEQNTGSAITITGLRDVTVAANTITMAPSTPPEWPAIALARCGRTLISDTVISDPRRGIAAAIEAGTTSRRDVRMRGVTVSVTPGVAQARFLEDTAPPRP
jgi:hypothetical protein